ncbi:MAG: helix-turn-helix transcriptional regulator [Desulfovibrio sp.]|nr:helix-turn-helix transcriptional regulator [Desulfovibrio sp.]
MSDRNNRTIMAQNIKRQMARCGVSRKEIASALQTPYSTVCEWISGNAYPRIDKIEQLASFFGVSKAEMVEDGGMLPLTPQDYRDIAKRLTETLDLLETGGDALMFDGEPLDPETRQLLQASLQNQLEMGKLLAKKKFSPRSKTRQKED